MFDLNESTVSKLRAKGTNELDLAAAIRKVIHSPLTALLVALTPTKADDTALEILKGLFPAT